MHLRCASVRLCPCTHVGIRLRQSLPENRLLIGLWNTAGDKDVLRERFGQARPDFVVATLQEALAQIKECEQQGESARWNQPAVEAGTV